MQDQVTVASSNGENTSTTISKKSGKGIRDGVISELTAFFHVKPGHEEELAAGVARFADVIRNTDPQETQKTGLRDTRHVIFDNGTRLLWATTFETDWDPYIDDAVLIVGFKAFVDWMQYTVEGSTIIKSMVDSVNAEGLNKASTGEIEQFLSANTSDLKRILQSVQAPAAGYWNMLADQTIQQIHKAQRMEAAFQQVLDNPEAEQALQHPALQPLLEEAAD